jgi:[acyl-carrier-protein] S-malonyltransferase
MIRPTLLALDLVAGLFGWQSAVDHVAFAGARHALAKAITAMHEKPEQAWSLEALAQTAIAPLAVPLVANVTASPVTEPSRIRTLLAEQVAGRVRWRESTIWMGAEDGGGVTRFVEVGVGDQLTGMVKRNAPAAEALALNEPADLEAFAKTL